MRQLAQEQARVLFPRRNLASGFDERHTNFVRLLHVRVIEADWLPLPQSPRDLKHAADGALNGAPSDKRRQHRGEQRGG